MIHYDNHYWGLPLLSRLYGSAFPRAFLFASLAGLETAMLYTFAPDYITKSLKNPTIFQIFGFVVGFALVFRSSLSYNRFWEARTMLQSVMGRLSYFTIETVAADIASMDHDAATPEQRKAAHRFCTELVHLVSLMFALKVKHLRKDFDLSTVYKHDMAGKAPFMDSNVGIRGWSRWEVFVVRVLALNDLLEIHNPQQEAEIPVVGGLRDDERTRLTNLVPTPAMKGRGAVINGARPYAVFALINQLYISRIKEGGLQTLPPLVSRLGGIAEEGMAAFGHCAKLAATQFPFPWAQVVMAFLAIMAVLLPFVVTSFVEQLWMAVVLSFIVVLTYWSLNEVASEMEDPFGFDPNDLPLARYAFDFNNGILAAVHQLRPPYFDELDAEAEAAGKSAAVAEALSPSGSRSLPGEGPMTPVYAPGPAPGPQVPAADPFPLATSPSQGAVPIKWVAGSNPATTDGYQRAASGASALLRHGSTGDVCGDAAGADSATGLRPTLSSTQVNKSESMTRAARKTAVLPVNT